MPISYSNTRLTTFKRCRLRYLWNYVKKQPQKEGLALRRGRAAHKALASFYAGRTPMKAIQEAWDEYSPHDETSLTKLFELEKILLRYMDWARDNDKWKVLEIETSVEAKYGRIHLMGIWDLLVNRGGKIFIVDHKFQKSHQMSHLEVDSQVSHYLALAKLTGVEVHGMIYNIINLELGETKTIAIREITTRQPYFIDSYLESLIPQVKEIKKIEKGTLPIYPNWTKDCCWDCSFYRQCVDTPFKSVSK